MAKRTKGFSSVQVEIRARVVEFLGGTNHTGRPVRMEAEQAFTDIFGDRNLSDQMSWARYAAWIMVRQSGIATPLQVAHMDEYVPFILGIEKRETKPKPPVEEKNDDRSSDPLDDDAPDETDNETEKDGQSEEQQES